MNGAHQMHVHDGAKLVDGHLRKRFIEEKTGVVDEDVNPAPLVHRQSHGALEHINLGIAEDHCCIWLQKVNCPQSPAKKNMVNRNQLTKNDSYHKPNKKNINISDVS